MLQSLQKALEPPDVPMVSEVLSGKVSTEELSELPPKELLLFVHNVLLEYYKESSTPPIFINAFVPLVRFNHDKYKLKCDLTFKNRYVFRIQVASISQTCFLNICICYSL